jgi:predicted permease
MGGMLNDLWYRMRVLLRRRRMDEEMDEELRYHLEREAAKVSAAAGIDEAEALRRARVALGGPELVRQRVRDGRGTRLIEDLLQDLRYGVRVLAKSPGFTVVAVLTLGLGIGACTAVFSLVNAVLLRALPYRDAGRLVYMLTPNSTIKGLPVEAFDPSYADFFDVQRESHSYAAMTAFEQASMSLAAQNSNAERVGVARVDAGFFSTLGSLPELGRVIGADDDTPGHAGVVVIGDGLWTSMFARGADVLTKTLRLDGRPYRVIGVMRAEFGYPHDYDLVAGNASVKSTQVWIPLALTAQQRAVRDDTSGYAVARLKDGVTVAQAQAEMAAIMVRLDLLHWAEMRGWGAFLKPLSENAAGGVRPLMWLLMGAVGLVLLIACGNAANLLLARAASRTHELGVRATLGAGRGRVIRQMLAESLLLGLGGGVLGVGIAVALVRGLVWLRPGNIPRLDETSLDGRVLLFTLAVALGTSVLFGIAPAMLVSRVNLVEFLKTGGVRGAVGDRNRVQSGLIVAEVALVVILLAGSGLLLHSYVNVQRVETGFAATTVSMNLQLDAEYGGPVQHRAFYRTLLDKAKALPGVTSAGIISNLPLANSEDLSSLWVDGYANQKHQLVVSRVISPGYFAAMGIPLLRGRFFSDQDVEGHPAVAVVNEAFAQKYFAGRDAVGGRIWGAGPEAPDRKPVTIVGVVANVRDATLEGAAVPEEFEPVWQQDIGGGFVVVRAERSEERAADTIAAEMRGILRGMDPNLALSDVRTMGERVSEASALRRFQTMLLAGFAGMALVLSLVGFYGLLAYSVKRRTAEIGLRIALGSPRARVLGMVVRQGMGLVLMGLGIGLAGALVLTRVLAGSLYGVSRFDPVTFVAVPALLVVVTVMASLIPGWRASGVEPVIALRCE